jgi:hypothetical protein
MKLPDPLRRATRTFLQAFVGNFLLFLVGPNFVPSLDVPDTGAFTKALFAAGFSAVIAVLSYLQNALENSVPAAAFMKPEAQVLKATGGTIPGEGSK